MNKIYQVKAMIKDSEESSGYRAIWQFNAIAAKSKIHAVAECKWTMRKVMGTIPKYKWIAELEWEDNITVN